MTYPYAILGVQIILRMIATTVHGHQLHTQTALLMSPSNSTCSTYQTVLQGQNLVLATVCIAS